jgi:hypothetical protein
MQNLKQVIKMMHSLNFSDQTLPTTKMHHQR